MEKIIAFLTLLTTTYLKFFLAGIILLCVLIIVFIVLGKINSNKRKIKREKENAKNAVSSLTPEEIDNISQNVADKDALYQMLTPAVEEAKIEEEKKKPSKKAKEEKIEGNKSIENSEIKEPENKGERAEKTTAKKSKKTTTPDKKEEVKTQPKKVATPTQTETATTKDKPIKKVAEPKTEEAPTQAASKKQAYSGKWIIKQQEGKFLSELIASNGSLLMRTKTYTSLSGIKNGIETIKKNIDTGNFVIRVDKHDHYAFSLLSPTNQLICISEDYSSKAKCENGIESFKRFAKTASVLVEEI